MTSSSEDASSAGLHAIYTAYGLHDSSQQEAVRRAYDVVRRHHGPFVASIASEMLADLREEVLTQPDLRIVFLGRDGFSLSVAVRAMDPQFHAAFCRDAVLSRAVVEAAVQDQEKSNKRVFSAIAAFRESKTNISDSDVDGASQRLTDYLQDRDIPIGRPGRVILVDSCLKGTIQEQLAALYPDTTFDGRYMFFDGIASDPHPGTKRGYVVHRDAGVGGGLSEIPDDPTLTFASIPAIRVIENLLQGPLSSPKRIGGGRPVQLRQGEIADFTWGCNPIVVSEDYRSPLVREAVKVAALQAVRDAARLMASDPKPVDIVRIRDEFTSQARAWLTRTPLRDTDLAVVLDSFVHRDDHPLVRQLDAALRDAGLARTGTDPLWQRFDQAISLEKKRELLEQVRACGRDLRAIRNLGTSSSPLPGGVPDVGGDAAARALADAYPMRPTPAVEDSSPEPSGISRPVPPGRPFRNL